MVGALVVMQQPPSEVTLFDLSIPAAIAAGSSTVR
jgi:hypothetical protein